MRNPPEGRFARGFTLLLTNLIKLGGLIVVLKEVFFPSGTNGAETLGIAAFMMAGAQLSESLMLSALDRLMGKHSLPPESPPPDPVTHNPTDPKS